MKKREKPKTLQTLYKRANKAGGQLIGIEGMVREKRRPDEILNVLFAIEGAVRSLIYAHFETIIKRYLAALLNELSEKKDLTPDLVALIAKCRKNFPRYKLKDLPKVFYDLQRLRLLAHC